MLHLKIFVVNYLNFLSIFPLINDFDNVIPYVFPSRTKGLEMLQDNCEYQVIHLNSNNFDKNELMDSINAYKPDSIICVTNVIATTIIDFIKEENR